MAENSVSATEANRSISVSRVDTRQAKEGDQRQAALIERQQSSQELRSKVIVEAQTGGNVDVLV